MPRTPPAFRLTEQHVAHHGGGQVLCLADAGIGRRWDLYPTRPDASYVARVLAADYGAPDITPILAPQPVAAEPPAVLRVDIRGPIDECAGYHDEGPCSAVWTDGNDAICERLCAAFAEGDVLLCVHSPGGNPAGAPEAMRRVLEAKAAHGRQCVVHCEGMAASLGLWWALVVGDEFYTTTDSEIGSIGCRGMHASVAGMLAIEGVVPTFSCWPDDGKIAGVAELPLSELGKVRNDAKVNRIGEAFALACASSPVGSRLGLTIDTIRALHADILAGPAAVGVLVDGLATVEECAAMMLSAAATPPATGDDMKTRAEGDPPEPENAPEGKPPNTVCGKCGVQQRPEAKLCDQCGTKMVAEDPKDDEKAPESGAQDPDAHRPAARVSARTPSPTLASVPALRAGLGNATTILDRACSMVGAKSHAELLGALEATCSDAGKAARYRTERDTERTRSDARERMDLLASLYTADPANHPRGKLVVDIVEAVNGRETITGQRPAKLWSDGAEGRTLANLRAYARATLAGLTPGDANPYDRRPREADARAADTLTIDAEIERAKTDPAVLLAAQYSTVPIADLARNHVLAARSARAVPQVTA